MNLLCPAHTLHTGSVLTRRTPSLNYQTTSLLCKMKPVVSTGNAYFCTVLSAFGIVILSVIGWLFKTGHESMMGSINDPTDGDAVAHTVFGAVFVYLAFFVFCGCQVLLIQRQDRIKL